MSNMLWPSFGGSISKDRYSGSRALNPNHPGLRDMDMKEADQQLEGRNPGLMHRDIPGQGGGLPAIGTDDNGPGSEIDPVKERGHMSPHADSRETRMQFPGPAMRDPGMQGTRSNYCGHGSQTQDVTGMTGVKPEVKGPSIGRGGSQKDKGESPNTGGMQSTLRSGDVTDPSPDIKRPSTSFGGLGRVQRESRHDGSAALEEMGHSKRGFQAHGGDAFFSDTKATSGSEGRAPGAMTDEKWGLQRGKPGPNIKNESSGPGSSRLREQFIETRPDMSTERSAHGTDRRELDPMYEYQDMGSSDTRGDGFPNISNPDWIGLRPGVGLDMKGHRGQNKGQGPQARGQDLSGPGSDIRDDWIRQDRRGPGPVREGPFEVGPRIIQPDKRGVAEVDFRGPRSEMIGPNMEQLRHERRRLVGADFMGQEPGQRGQSRNNLGPGIHGPGGPDFGPVLERRGLVMDGPGPINRQPGGPHFTGPERKEPALEGQGADMRILAGPDFGVSRPEIRGSDMGGLRPERGALEGPGPGPDFSGPGPDTRGLSMECPGPDRRGPGVPDSRRPGPERCFSMEGPWPDRRGPGGQDFRGPGAESGSFSVGGPGPEIRGLRGPDFSGPGPDSGGLYIEGPGPVRNQPGGQSLRGLGPQRRGKVMGGPGPDKRGSQGPDFRGPGLERRGPATEIPGPDRPDIRAMGSDRRGLSVEGPGPDRRGPGGPDFRGPGPHIRIPAMEGPRPDRRGPGGTDFREPGPYIRSTAMEGSGPDRRGPRCSDFRGPGPHIRSPAMEGPRSDRRGPGGTDFTGPDPERRGLAMEGPGPERRGPALEGPGGPDFMGPEPHIRGAAMEGPGPVRRGPGSTDFRGPDPDRRGAAMEGPGSERRGPGGPDFRRSGPERRSPAKEGPGPDWRGPVGPDFRGSKTKRRSLSVERPRPDSRGSGCPDIREELERRGSAMEVHGPNKRGPGGPDFSGPGSNREHPAMGCLWPARRESEIPDFSVTEHERRCPTMDSQESDRRGPGHPGFQGLQPENKDPAIDALGPGGRGPGRLEFKGPGYESRGISMKGQGPDRSGLEDQNTDIHGADRRGPYLRGPGTEFTGMGPERSGPGIEGTGPDVRGHRGQQIRGPGPQRGQQNIEGPGLDRRGPFMRPEGPCSSMDGPAPNSRVPGGPDMRRPGLQYSDPSREGPGADRRGPEIPHFKPGGIPPNMEGPESDWHGRHIMEGPGSEIMCPRGPDFGDPNFESGCPGVLYPELVRPEPGKRRHLDIEGLGPECRISGGPDFRGPGIRQKGPTSEGLRPRRDNWEGVDFGGFEPIQERQDIVGQGTDRTGRNLRGSRPIRGGIRKPRPDTSSLNREDNFRGSALDRRGTDIEEQWSDERGPSMESVGNERECSGDDWRRYGNRGPSSIQEGPDEQVEEHSWEDPCEEWRDPKSRGPRFTQDRPNIQFPEPLRGRGDDWSGPVCRGPGHVEGDEDIVFPGPGRGGPGSRWRGSQRGGAEPNRRGRGAFFSGETDPDNRSRGCNRRGPNMGQPGSDLRGGHIENVWMQPDLRGNMGRPGMKGRGAPEMNSCPNRRDFEIEGLDGRVPRGPNSRFTGPENRNSNFEAPVTDERFSHCAGLASERLGVDEENPRTGRQHDFRRGRRGAGMRRPGLVKADRGASERLDIRHGHGRWDTHTEGPTSARRGPEMGPELELKDDMQGSNIRGGGCDSRGPNLTASPHFNSPHLVDRSQGHRDPHSATYNETLGPTQNRGGNSRPGFDKLQNQHAVKPQRYRAALLPTPTSITRFPNHMINNPDVLSPKRKEVGHPTNRTWSRERELIKGQRQTQETSPSGKKSTAEEKNKGEGEGKKEVSNVTVKQDTCVENKTKDSLERDGNKSNVKPI